MSSRLPTRSLSRSASSSMVASSSWSRLGREVDVVGEQAGGRRLDRRQRGAQVVRHRPEQGGAQLVGLRPAASAVGRLGLQLAAAQGDGQLVGEGPQHPPVVRGQVGPGDGEHACRRRARRCRSPRRASAAGRSPAAATICQPPPVPAQQARPRRGRRWCCTWPITSVSGSCSVSSAPASRTRIAASARLRVASSDRRAAWPTSHDHHRGHAEEHDERHEVLGLGDGEGVQRRGEVPVGEQVRRPPPRPAPAHVPPTAATTTTSARNSSRSAGRATWWRRLARISVSRGRPTTADQPRRAAWRRGESAPPARRTRRGGRLPASPWRPRRVVEMTWTSRSPAWRITG